MFYARRYFRGKILRMVKLNKCVKHFLNKNNLWLLHVSKQSSSPVPVNVFLNKILR